LLFLFNVAKLREKLYVRLLDVIFFVVVVVLCQVFSLVLDLSREMH
jgi:hypothetical protein